jgi:hypothetical protein
MQLDDFESGDVECTAPYKLYGELAERPSFQVYLTPCVVGKMNVFYGQKCENSFMLPTRSFISKQCSTPLRDQLVPLGKGGRYGRGQLALGFAAEMDYFGIGHINCANCILGENFTV